MERLEGCSLEDVALVELEALDDGPPRATSFAEVPLDAARDLPTLPPDAQAFVARGRSRDGRLVAHGVFPVHAGAAEGPLFPIGAACGLLGPGDAPARFPIVVGRALGFDGRTTLLAGGRDADDEAQADLLVADAAHLVRLGMRRRRAAATVVVLGARAIVAGGEASSGLWEDAEIVDLEGRAVSPDALLLSEPRAAASGLALASGEALLVGGRGPRGALRTLEALDLGRRVSRSIDLASLSRPRVSPLVLRLATGEIAVLGGRDDVSAPVPDIEVFDAAASRRLSVLPFPARAELDAVSLSSGALLVVTRDPSGVGAALVRPDAIEALPPPPLATMPRLVSATDGSPFLLADVPLRYQPFLGTFSAVALPTYGASAFPLGAGVLGWIEPADGAAAIRAVRYDVRTELVSDPEPLGLGSTAHLVPDRLGVSIGREGLVMPAGARVAIADATYGAFSLRLGAVGRALPDLELRDSFGALVARVDDGGACTWPSGTADVTELSRATDGTLTLRVGAVEKRCAVTSSARVSISLVARAREARVRGVTVVRA